MPSDALDLPDGLTGPDLLRAVGAHRLAAAGEPLHLVGHGSSGIAVLSLALHQRRLGLDLAGVTCLGAAGQADPLTGVTLARPDPPRRPTSVLFVAGADPASVDWTAATAAAWAAAGWDVIRSEGTRPPNA